MVLEQVTERASTTIKDNVDLALVVAGTGGAAAVAGVVKSYLPEQTEGLEDEKVAVIAGALIWYYGDRVSDRLVPFGFGVLLEGLGSLTSEWVAGIIDMLKKKEA